MILSVSRRTDIPNYYSDWFLNRIKEGFLYVRNPMNIHQVSKIDISPNVVDCIVFWTKNPEHMIDKLDQLKEYKYYFQFTLTGYGKDMESGLPHKKEKMIPTFKKLSENIGKEKVIWRYDPILITDRYSVEYHLKAFQEIACSLDGFCERVVISFVDLYAKTKKNMRDIKTIEKGQNDLIELTRNLFNIAQKYNMEIETCAETIDLAQYGIKHSSCIDKKLIEKIIGCQIIAKKDKNQREECGCIESIEVGVYNTCLNGCKYCYANYSQERVTENRKLYDVNSPILCSKITDEDKITQRAIKSIKEEQMSMSTLFE